MKALVLGLRDLSSPLCSNNMLRKTSLRCGGYILPTPALKQWGFTHTWEEKQAQTPENSTRMNKVTELLF